MAYAISQERCDRLKKLLEIHTIRDACRLVGIAPCTGWAIRKRGFTSRNMGVQALPVPADLSLNANNMTIKQLMAHYHIDNPQVHRLLKAAGIVRSYKPKVYSDPLPIPPREEIEKAYREHGAMGGAAALGVAHTTFRAWRYHYGLRIHHKRRTMLQERAAAGSFGWAERYQAERQAA